MPLRRRPGTKRKTKRARIARPRPRRASPAIVVSSLEEARAALAEARGRPVTLVSPPDAAAYLGVGFFWALAEAARSEFPRITIEAVMDCGADPGFALSALRTGFDGIVLRGNPRARARVAAIARSIGAHLLVRSPRKGTGRRGAGEKKGE